MNLKQLVKSLSLAILISLTFGCANTEVQREYLFADIQRADRPEPVSLYDIEFFVVTEDNIQDFFKRLKENKGEVVFVAIKVSDYEKLALNMAEIKRYMKQQDNLILYYESVTDTNKE